MRKGKRSRRSRGSRTRQRASLVLALALTAGLTATVPAGADDPAYAFRDPRSPRHRTRERPAGRLTLDEKVSLLHQYEPAIPRLGIQSFRTGTEALHGVAWLGRATVFPQAIGLASTWDPALIQQVGSAVGDEARGFQQERPDGWGLNLWAPVVNLLRDPRWGRNEEGYSEDPYLTGSISTAYGEGLTGGDPDHLKTAPTLKHYLANNNEVNRATTSSDLRPRVQHVVRRGGLQTGRRGGRDDGRDGVVQPGQRPPRHGEPGPGRRRTDVDLPRSPERHRRLRPGQPAPRHPELLRHPRRGRRGGALAKAGIDSFTDNNGDSAPTTTAVKSALGTGLLKESDVDTAVSHILAVRVRLSASSTRTAAGTARSTSRSSTVRPTENWPARRRQRARSCSRTTAYCP